VSAGDPSHLLRATFRSPRFVVSYQLAALVVLGLSSLPSAGPLFPGGARVTLPGLGVIMATNLAATWAYHRRGEGSRGYRVVALLELCTFQFTLMWMIFQGGASLSIWWIVWLAQAASNGGFLDHYRAMMAAYIVPPLVLALAFWLGRSDGAGTIMSLFGAIVGFLIFSAGLRTHQRLARAVEEREAALAELTELRIRDERARIARDLHDGVAADLVAVAMRADWARIAPESLREQELREIAGRTREAIDDLRTVVWTMRSPTRDASELASYIEQRCRELCGRAISFEMRSSLRSACPVPGAFALELLRIAQECCRNAVRHGEPSVVSLDFQIDDAVLLRVEDDGRGLPEGVEGRKEGGLVNLRTRSEKLGGSFQATRLPRGTRVEARLPLPS
jgi:signal transduction histidine kinase